MILRKRFLILLFSALLLLQSISLASCNKVGGKEAEKYTTHSFEYFDTATTITGYAQSKEEFDSISADILKELGEYHRLFTIYNRYEGLENLCTINDLSEGEHRTISVDRRIIDMLLYAKELYEITGGNTNVAMGSVLSIWHDYRQEGTDDPTSAALPPMEALAEAAKHTDISKVVIDEENCTVTLTDPKMKLDVGAVAKGYAVEMAAKSLYQKGITGYVINVGGNVRTVGSKANGESWTVGVQDPDPEKSDYLAYLTLKDSSLVTSGSYQRYYIVDGKKYHHIIDPETLMPAHRYTSVSVLCRHSGLGDGLSTALFCMTPEEGLELVESMEGVEAMWVTNDGEQIRSSGFPKE